MPYHNHRTPKPLVLGVLLAIAAMPLAAQAQETNAASGDAGTPIQVGTVSAEKTAKTKAARELKKLSGKFTPKTIFHSAQTEAAVNRDQIKAVGPAGGAAQALSMAPGIHVYGYGGVSGTARYEISVRGIKVGWSSVNGDVERNGITVLFDGIPMNNLIAHNVGWDSNEIPILQMIEGVNVIYGPGDPEGRWFDSLGGTINFVPVQPSAKPSANIGLTFGSYGTLGYHFDVKSGVHDGWSAVLAGGYQKNNTFRTGSFNAPSQAFAYFGKVTKLFQGGAVSFGGYVDSAREFRPNFIPLTPIPGVTEAGLNANAPLYSQPTSGFYSSLPESVWFKQIKVQDYMLYGKMHLALTKELSLHDLFWYRHGHRVHYRITNFIPGNSANTEYYNPSSDTYGDKLWFAADLPYNLVQAGGYWIRQKYVTPYVGYNTQLGTSPSFPNQYNLDYLYNTYLTGFLQDRITPVSGLSITPGLAAAQFQTEFFNAGFDAFPKLPASANNTQAPDSSKTFTRLEPSVSVRYASIKELALYGHYAETYQNPTDNTFGAYNSNQGTVDLSSLQPVKSTDYELGTKLYYPHAGVLGRVAVNLNYFHDRLSNETVTTYLTNISQTKFATAAAIYNGVSLDVSARPNWHWHVFGNITFQHNYYTNYLPSGGGQPYDGYPISYSPNLTLNAGLSYSFLWDDLRITPRVNDQYVGKQYLFSNLTGAPTRETLPSYNLVNLAVGLETTAMDRYVPTLRTVSLDVGVYNLFDTQYNPTGYITSGGYFGGNSAGAELVDPGAPREYFVDVGASF